MKITLDIKVHPEFGPNVDVQPDEEFWTLSNEQQFCFEKGWREGAASVRAAIRARGN